jgi:hypothetical protein
MCSIFASIDSLAGAAGANPMLNYEICYTDRRGALVGKISAECSSRTHAAVLAHAMKFRKWLGVEVWEGERLIMNAQRLS